MILAQGAWGRCSHAVISPLRPIAKTQGKTELIMRELVLSLLAGWIFGIVLTWFKIPIPAPPLVGLLGLAGMGLGSWCFGLLGKLMVATHN
jgi:XapX domain-containing protein